ncbi:hypothetical protein ZWY2020_026484 [Hordeum vulgare]|nr:hypothetical protein ZWY2020_026484 [Hordeum vulgare]
MKSVPSPPPAPPTPAASEGLRHLATRSRVPHCTSIPPLRPDSSLPSSTARSEAHPWLGFRAGLRRRIFGGPRLVPPSFLAGILHPYTSPSLPILCYICRCTPWVFPIHHSRRRQATNLPNAVSSLSTGRFLPPPPCGSHIPSVSFIKNADKKICVSRYL